MKKLPCLRCDIIMITDKDHRICHRCTQDNIRFQNLACDNTKNIKVLEYEKRWKDAKNPLDKWKLL